MNKKERQLGSEYQIPVGNKLSIRKNYLFNILVQARYWQNMLKGNNKLIKLREI
jgi:hypothetical protein